MRKISSFQLLLRKILSRKRKFRLSSPGLKLIKARESVSFSHLKRLLTEILK